MRTASTAATRACEVVSSLNDDGSTVVFNFPRALSGTVTAGLENKSEIYATGLVARPAVRHADLDPESGIART